MNLVATVRIITIYGKLKENIKITLKHIKERKKAI